MEQKLIVGLGNPGSKYINNRHNVGHFVADELLALPRTKGLVIKKSDRFMNDSGTFVKKQMAKYASVQISDMYIIHDDLDIPLGVFKIQFGKGPKVHNGLNDIYEKLGTNEFWHVRVGVDNRDPENKQSLANFVGRAKGKDYVLEDFTEGEQAVLNRVSKEICNQLVH